MPTLSPSLLTNTNVFYGPLLTHTLKPGLLTNTAVFYAPTITAAAVVRGGGGSVRCVDREPRLAVAIEGYARTRSRRQRAASNLTERQRRDSTRYAYVDSTLAVAVLATVDRASEQSPPSYMESVSTDFTYRSLAGALRIEGDRL